MQNTRFNGLFSHNKGRQSGHMTTYVELVGRGEFQLLAQLLRGPSTEPVEDVIVTLLATLDDHAGLLQQVMRDEATRHRVL